MVGPNYASNNWVVDGRHSASGKPVLANDPHLAFGTPGYGISRASKTPQHEITGATAAGVPLVVIGHNERIAWGFTTTTADVEDLFVEQVDPADPGRYLTPQGSAPFKSRRETIIVKGAAPVEITIRETRHGPVLSDALPPGAAEPGFVLALAATFTIPDDRSAEALWEVNRAADWPSFRAALRHFVGPTQNIVYADVDGTIGFIAPGRVPIRRNGQGWLPAPGWTGDYDWTGFIPFDALPSAVNPRIRPLCHRQQQDRAGQLSLFPQPRLGPAQPRRADRSPARGDAGADTGVERRNAGRYVVADGPAPGSADDRCRRAKRRDSGGGRAAATLGFSHGYGQGRAVAVHRLAARVQPLDPVRPAWRGGVGLLGFAAPGHARRC